VISPSVLFHEPKLCLLIHLFFSQRTPLILSAYYGFVEICRLLVASKADVAARLRCRSPWRARNLPLTPCVAAPAKLHSNTPSNKTRPTLLHTFAVSARRNDAAPPRQP
jgi:ankyrin repeat protein